jgi:hypothetical protein
MGAHSLCNATFRGGNLGCPTSSPDPERPPPPLLCPHSTPMARIFAALALLLPTIGASRLHPREWYEEKFVDWSHEHGKSYSGREFVHR